MKKDIISKFGVTIAEDNERSVGNRLQPSMSGSCGGAGGGCGGCGNGCSGGNGGSGGSGTYSERNGEEKRGRD